MTPRIIGLYSPAPQSGKSTVARILVADHGFTLRPFAAPLRAMLWELLRQLGLKDQAIRYHLLVDKAASIPGLDHSGRELLQTLGTDWGRQQVDPDLWVKCWAAGARTEQSAIVADDVRFPNEAAVIQAMGGEVWRIVRPGATVDRPHASEGGLDDWPFDLDLGNNGTIAELQAAVKGGLQP